MNLRKRAGCLVRRHRWTTRCEGEDCVATCGRCDTIRVYSAPRAGGSGWKRNAGLSASSWAVMGGAVGGVGIGGDVGGDFGGGGDGGGG